MSANYYRVGYYPGCLNMDIAAPAIIRDLHDLTSPASDMQLGVDRLCREAGNYDPGEWRQGQMIVVAARLRDMAADLESAISAYYRPVMQAAE